MTEPEKRPPSITKDIRTLYQAADWPEGKLFVADAEFPGDIIAPDGSQYRIESDPEAVRHEGARAEFVVAAANYFLRHLREIEAREKAK